MGKSKKGGVSADLSQLENHYRKAVAALQHRHDQNIRTLTMRFKQQTQKLQKDDRLYVVMHEQLEIETKRAGESLEFSKDKLELQFRESKSVLHDKQAELDKVEAARVVAQQELLKTRSYLKKLKTGCSGAHESAVHRVDDLQVKLDKIRGQMKELEKRSSSDRTSVRSMGDQRDKFKRALDACVHEKDKLYDMFKKTKLSHSKLLQGLALVDKNKTDYLRRISQLEASLEKKTNMAAACQTAVSDKQAELQACKKQFVEAHAKQRDTGDRLEVVEKAIKKTKHGSGDPQDIIKSMDDDYRKLKKQSEVIIKKLFASIAKNRELEAANKTLVVDKTELKAKLKAQEAGARKDAQDRVAQARAKCNKYHESESKHHDHLSSLRSEVSRLTSELSAKKCDSGDCSDKIDRVYMDDVKSRLSQVSEENGRLRRMITAFERSRVELEQLKGKHGKVMSERQHMRKMLGNIREYGRNLAKRRKTNKRKLSNVSSEAKRAQKRVNHNARLVKQLSDTRASLGKRMESSVYTGERSSYSGKLDRVERQQTDLQEELEHFISEHASLVGTMDKLEEENKNLRDMQIKYDEDSRHMLRIVEESSKLLVELNRTKDALKRKESQSKDLAKRLTFLIKQITELEKVQTTLSKKLDYTTDPEEVRKINNKLSTCQSKMKDTYSRYAKIDEIVKKLHQQNETQRIKIVALVDTLKDTEEVRSQFMVERGQRIKLERALDMCAEKQKVNTRDLASRIEAMEQMREIKRKEHGERMQDSDRRIRELEGRLKSAIDERDTNTPLEQVHESMPAEYDDRMNELQKKNESDMTALRKELSSMKQLYEEKNQGIKDALNESNLRAEDQLVRMKDLHNQSMRKKEHDILRIREEINDGIIDALGRANADANVNPQDVYRLVASIRDKGAAAENSTLIGMGDMRQINNDITSRHNAARTNKWSLLSGAAEQSRQSMVNELAGARDEGKIRQYLDDFTRVRSLQNDFLVQQRQGSLRDMDHHRSYINTLQRQEPRFRTMMGSFDMNRFPELGVQNQYAQEEYRSLQQALANGQNQSIAFQRSSDSILNRLNALNADVKSASDDINRYLLSPSDTSLLAAKSTLARHPSDVLRYNTFHAGMNDPVRSIMAQRYGNSEHSQLDQQRGLVMTSAGVHPVTVAALKPTPDELLNPPATRAAQSFRANADYIVLSVSFKTDKNYDFALFRHALKKIHHRIQPLATNGAVKVQIVQLDSNGSRKDLLGDKSLDNGCTYESCASTVSTVNIGSDELDNLVQKALPEALTEVTHVVVTLSSNEGSHIHLTDMVFNSIPTQESLFDQTWVQYLSKSIRAPPTKLELIFDQVPPNSQNDQQRNASLAKMSAEINGFISKMRQQQVSY